MSESQQNEATVLVVDDTPTKLYILSSWLRRAGHQVVQATGGVEALAKVRELQPDLVVLDVRLPDITGYEVCEQIKADETTSSIPVIQISGAAVTPADRAQGLERGADAYLAEPVEPDEFAATVEATLRYYRARQRAERMARRLTALTEVTLAMNAAETFDDLLATAVEGTSRILGRTAGTLALPPDGRTRRFSARPAADTAVSKVAPPETLTRLSAMSLDGAAGTRVFTTSIDEWLKLVPDADISGDVMSVLCRTKVGRPPVYLGIDAVPPLDEDEINILRQLGQALALTVDALRAYTEEHTIALTLQRSLLPARIPDIPGLTISWRYQPAVDNVEVGGDFYEVLKLDHRVLIAIGDVQGHSLLAATVMAELRHALRASVIANADLGASMALLNNVLRCYHPGMTATVCLTLLDPATGELEIANAGHIPPLLIGTGEAVYHNMGNLLLGVAEETYRVDSLTLPERGSVLMFTDGLVEDRDKLLDESLEIARRLADDTGCDLEAFCDRLIARFGAREDDVALVMFRREAAG
ncbi:CheY-like chemotaxis protein [Streptosporangium becharense]|uniref:CheY-like chemotaxis protein n=1 Tax=Streptosporangium becharense TaxID=1816182 RepID=A0A7W9IDI6_9ACTN|nr:SpoIIE family protein phosphatase [Streptosporangium becharense]MBB2912186.1 CheY-like chemotaxis protein [Streptosporangium becharense]MBB5818733.1 CheY-like chemotaxis protein [Streptosporangium becharense]